MTRFRWAILMTGFLGMTVGGLAVSGTALAGDSAKCTIATSGASSPAKACAKGGRAEAKKTMKAMVAEAKVRGHKFSCDGCHKDLETYELTKSAKEDLKQLEALVAKK
jgi:hypothetical protein